jgi:hypothetical protein
MPALAATVWPACDVMRPTCGKVVWALPPESAKFVAMELNAVHTSPAISPDRRQSETALAIARGTTRLLRSLGFACVSELPLPSGRRADLAGLNERGETWIVEIKSSIEDLRVDQKWP